MNCTYKIIHISKLEIHLSGGLNLIKKLPSNKIQETN